MQVLDPNDQHGYFRDQQIVFEGDGLWTILLKSLSGQKALLCG